MRTCVSCRRENPGDARFCISCGAPLGLFCDSCGAELPGSADFCPACGAPVAVRMLLAGEERKVVTVLFADIVESTARAERLDPEDVLRLHSPYFARVRAEVERFGGIVEKFIGDAVVAIFGAPLAHEDDPERAVRAALAIRDAMGELNADAPDLDLHIRVAVNTGEVVVTLDARASEGEGMVAGDVMNTCSRLQTAAPVDGILVGEATYRATAEAIEYVEVDGVRAKGKSAPVAAWLAVDIAQDVPARPQTQLVGRIQELSHLLDALARVSRERTPQLVSLVGAPGIGKTRLVGELVGAVEAEPQFGSWLRGRCLPYGDGVSFGAIAEMARSQAGVLATDSTEEALAKLRIALEALNLEADPERVETHLWPLIGLGGDEETAEHLEESFAAWRRFFEALAEHEPLVLVFEDLHWADPTVLDFVDHLVDWASGVPLLVVCTARPELLERRPGWGGGKRNAITITLSPLTEHETEELVGALLGQAELPAETAAPLLARTGGNPLYAEEYARMLLERGYLVQENGGWKLAAAELPLPETVQGTIAARVDVLPPDEKALLQYAAVVGKVFWQGAVAAVADVERPQAERLLHSLERKEFVRRERRSLVAGDVQYVFRHVLVRDVAYGELPRSNRAEAHRLSAEWLEALPRRREDQPELVTHHYRNALQLARASGYESDELVDSARRAAREAGDRALALHAFSAAAQFYEQALELWPEDGIERARLRFSYGKALVEAEGAGADVLADASRELFEAGEPEHAAEAEVFQAVVASREGAVEAAAEHVQRAALLVLDTPPSQSKAHVLARLAGLVMTTDPAEAVRLGGDALRMSERLGLDDLRAHALTTIGFSKATVGEQGGVDDLEQAVAVAVASMSPESIRARSLLAAVLAHQGDLAGSSKLRAEAWSDAERFGKPSVIRFLECESIAESYWSGGWDEALRIADDFIAKAEAGLRHYGEILAYQVRAEMRLAAGQLAGALDDAARSVEIARSTGHPQSLYPALATEARACLDGGEHEKAEALVDELLSQWTRAPTLPASFWLADLVIVLEARGRASDLDGLAALVRAPTLWLDAALAFAREPQKAARLYAEIGSRPDEAFARLHAAEILVAGGSVEQAEGELTRALRFYEGVGAAGFARRARRLLEAPA